MAAKSSSLVSSELAILSVKPTEDLEYRKRGNSAMKIRRKPGDTSRDYVDPSIATFVSHSQRSVFLDGGPPFSKARHASVHN